MAAQAFDNLQLLLQLLQATRNLARDMVQNANTHKAMATAQSPDVVTLGRFVTDSAASYNRILSAAKAWVQANNAQATAAVGLIGATVSDLNTYTSPIQTAIAALAAADLSTYAAIISACNNVLATVPSPNSVFASMQSF
jgi:hypothetical protein